MLESYRPEDSRAEKEVAKFLDKHLYGLQEFSDVTRFTDRENQLKGRDLIFSLGELKKIIVDEKAQTQHVNKGLPTFAFEINSFQNNRLVEGWLFDNAKDTEYYLLIWITAKKEKNFSEQDIIKLDCILISRKRILDFLNTQNLDYKKCSEISKELRTNNIWKASHRNEFDSCYFFLTQRLAEIPLNIVIYKEKLIELSTKIFEVKNTD